MPNILLLGAKGYIGTPLAQSLLRSGTHHVYGVVRRPEVAKSLLADEVTPVVGSVEDTKFLKSAIAQHDIDVVVNCTSAHQVAAATLNAVIEAGKERAETLRSQTPPAIGPKLGYIYTSGSSIYGSPSKRVSDRSPVGNALARGQPGTLTKEAKVIETEQLVLAARDVLDVAVVRPHVIYGRSSWALGSWFGPLLDAKKKKDGAAVAIPAEEDSLVGVVHVDDVVSGFHAIVDRIEGRLGTWPVFDLFSETLPLPSVIDAAKEAAGVDAKVEYVGTKGDPFLELLSMRSRSDASRARTVLGWVPRRVEFLLNVESYFCAFEAHLEGKEVRMSL